MIGTNVTREVCFEPRNILLYALLSVVLVFASCSHSERATVIGDPATAGNPNSSSTGKISFATLQLAPPALMALAQTASFAAIVAADPGNKGVDWSVSCTPSANVKNAGCGVITAHTASGYPTTYTAPGGDLTANSIPIGGTVTVTAASTADPKQTVSTTIQISVRPVTIGYSKTPPSSVLGGSATQIIPVVTNDVYKNGILSGVDLSLTCASPGACGSISPTHTDGNPSGNGADFTAPAVVPPGGTVTITATSTADPTQSISSYVTITQGTVTVQYLQAPVLNLPIGASTNANILVTNDPYNAGVDWSLSCQSGDCGSLSLTHTTSGQVTVYSAPASVPAGDTVTLTASSSIDPAVFLQSVVTITPSNPRNDLLAGRYAFLLQGVKAGGPWAIAGSFFADGIGNISSAVERVQGVNDPFNLTGSYLIRSDGTGTITLSGAPSGMGYWHNGQQVFKVSVVSANRIFMEEFDGYYDPDLHVPYSGSLRGTLEPQKTINSFPPGSGFYSLLLSGTTAQSQPAFYGGTINTFSNVFYMDRSIAGVVDSTSGNASFIPASGDNNSGTMLLGSYTYGYFVVDPNNWILIATAAQSDIASGRMYRQPSMIGLPGGKYAFVGAGAQVTPQGSVPTAQGGFLQCDSFGNLTGLLDSNLNGTLSSAQVAGSCSIASTGPQQGRGTLTLTSGTSRKYAIYLTATRGILMLDLDSNNPGVATALLQSGAGAGATAATFSGNYALQLQSLGQVELGGGGVGSSYDFLGTINADGNSKVAGKVSLDQFDEISRLFWTQTPDVPISGSFKIGPSGRFIGSFTLPPLGTTQQILYFVDGSTVLTLGADVTPSTGALQLQTF
jgi:hypothetical protein